MDQDKTKSNYRVLVLCKSRNPCRTKKGISQTTIKNKKMRKLKVYLEDVQKSGGKIQNVVSHVIKNEKELAEKLNLHDGNIKKFEIMNMK